jgi:AAA+ ATPase superfamily predicted ATPase
VELLHLRRGAIVIKPAKPEVLHDRDHEWSDLLGFVSDPQPGARLGLVYGRRRQGKTMLLELLVETCGGFIFTGLQQSNRQNLQDLSAAYARHVGLPGVTFANWRDAIDALLRLGENSTQPLPVVLDEFPYLLSSAPELASVIQNALSPRGRARHSSRARLILCGSAVATMRGLLDGSAPLRGRASLELILRPFGFRDAAAFWKADDPELAFRLHALVGGTPAYQDMSGDRPRSLRAFDSWVSGRLLNPASAMFREGNVLLQEQTELTDASLYYSVLAAISRGSHRRSEIAGILGRPETSLAHALAMLEHTQLVQRLDDAFRQRRPLYTLTEPVIRFHQLIIRPHEARLVGRAGQQVWAEAADTVTSLIYGPHMEDLARDWCQYHADRETLGGRASTVRRAVVACREHRQGHELDVVVTEANAHGTDRVIAIGEVKSTTKTVGEQELSRLDHIRAILPSNRIDSPPRLLLFSRSGFTPRLRAHPRDDTTLIDLSRLYTGN